MAKKVILFVVLITSALFFVQCGSSKPYQEKTISILEKVKECQFLCALNEDLFKVEKEFDKCGENYKRALDNLDWNACFTRDSIGGEKYLHLDCIYDKENEIWEEYQSCLKVYTFKRDSILKEISICRSNCIDDVLKALNSPN